MIIDVPYKTQDAISIKTTGGEELIARFVEEDANTITIERPMVVMATQQGLGLGPYSFTVDPKAKFKLNKNAIVFVHKTEADMAKQYISSTSGIQMV